MEKRRLLLKLLIFLVFPFLFYLFWTNYYRKAPPASPLSTHPLPHWTTFIHYAPAKPHPSEPPLLPNLLVATQCDSKYTRLNVPIPNFSYRPRNCGEDAYTLGRKGTRVCMGVADGVGGWGEKGVDPSQFAWTLMNNTAVVFHDEANTHKNPVDLLQMAFDHLIRAQKVLLGSCTACIVVVNLETGMLEAANLGDSGFLVYRKNETVLRSKEQTIGFNFPYQLSALEGTPPKSADLYTFRLEPNDLILIASDGLFDNIYPETIGKVLDNLWAKLDDVTEKEIEAGLGRTKETLQERRNWLHVAATKLKDLALSLGTRTDYLSPFCKNAAEYGQNVLGGKLDDTTLVLSLVL